MALRTMAIPSPTIPHRQARLYLLWLYVLWPYLLRLDVLYVLLARCADDVCDKVELMDVVRVRVRVRVRVPVIRLSRWM
jgi:hypothetical protein